MKNNGFLVFAPGRHEGICTVPYVVIEEGETAPVSSGVSARNVEFSVFCPLDHYIVIGEYMNELIGVLCDLKELKFANIISPVEIDDRTKAYKMTAKFKIFSKRRD